MNYIKIKQAMRHYYFSLPLPRVVRRGISLLYHKVIMKNLRLLLRRVSVEPFCAPIEKTNIQQMGMPDYLMFGIIDWHFRHQRPQQLALALVKTGRRVFYISPDMIDDNRCGFKVEPLDASGMLFQVKLFAKNKPIIYSSVPNHECLKQLIKSLGEVLDWANCNQLIGLVQHPFWSDLASALPNSRLVYDCMDHHAGFSKDILPSLVAQEQILSTQSEWVITTSVALNQSISDLKQKIIIRNATDYGYFSKKPEKIYEDSKGRPIIGYYGAIAEWFDIELVEMVAMQNPDSCVLLIGADTVNARARLQKMSNVVCMGEVPYKDLPYYLYAFDLCLLPFKINALTLATNPVKVYEYLSAGKPVISVDLPEMVQFNDLVYVANGHKQFLEKLKEILENPEPQELINKRQCFAKEQTWEHRAATLIQAVESTTQDPLVSVVVVTYNNLALTRACLFSLEEHSQYDHLEIIVVDNASSDGSQAFLREWAGEKSNRQLILNDENLGFSAANNQGLSIAKGEYLVLLNNDTYVTPGWIRTLVQHLKRDNTIGLIGPVTNNIGNEAKIDIHFNDMQEMLIEAKAYTRRHIGETYPLQTAAFFCVMIKREIYEKVGPLDEAFGKGFFEDDDYCRRVEQLGLRIVCAEDVFIYHHLSASFNKLKNVERQKLFEKNKMLYETKWGKWIPHSQRSLLKTRKSHA